MAQSKTPSIQQLSVNTIRTLSMDAIQKANSGHPGTPMALAPVAYELWQNFLNYDPADPIWLNRDRFVLSNGHASMLLYSLMYLCDVQAVTSKYQNAGHLAVSLEDIKNFRQLDSRCAGHPEYRFTSGVETTTGPLGQGVANSVGMAIAAQWLGSYFNRPGFEMFDFKVYAIAGDGCLMEGVATEAASFAGHLKLSNLCWIYDSNRITIEGTTDLTFTEDVATRFLSYGWNVKRVSDANDLQGLAKAYAEFRATTDKPTLIIVDSHIGYGAPTKQDTKEAHGEPLGAEEIKGAKRFYGWPEDAQFLVPDGVKEHFKEGIGARGKKARDDWFQKLEAYRKEYPQLAEEIMQIQHRQLPKEWDKDLPVFEPSEKGLATRDSSHKVLNAVAKRVPWLMGGSADLAPSTKTLITDPAAGSFEPGNPLGRNMHFGLREHAMAAILNGMALVKVRAYGATFLTFSDYARPAIRLSALMELPVIYIFTHDSIGLGEDGPTHQPVEHLVSLRAIPGLLVFRPADANEVTESWRVVMQLRHEPAALILTRQAIPTFDRQGLGQASLVAQGAYVLKDCSDGQPDVLLLATGSEVQLCLKAYDELAQKGIKARVVSMPCWELFERQPAAYKESVLPKAVKARVAVEQASELGWERYVGEQGQVIAMHTFGRSAPIKELAQLFGFTPDKVVEAAVAQVKLARGQA